ncbi:MAG: amidase [Pseudomonadota bacterium]|nr:amidase [Pseudomonadota bacterium]
MSEPLHYQPLMSVAQQLRSKELSARALTEHMLTRISRLDNELLSYATVTPELARAQAQRAEEEIQAGRYRGFLHGVPVAIKDLCCTAGIRTMGGLKVRQQFVPEFNATVVQKLEDAGAVLLGKLNLTEGALSAYNPEFPIPKNPWGKELWAGVSSSGSGVAVAAGLCFAAIGTDTGGSIRYPAMANGVTGLKPTYGRVSRHGVLALAESLDHVGPMARSVADAVALYNAITGYDENDQTSLNREDAQIAQPAATKLNGLRLGVDADWFSYGTDPGLLAALEQAIGVFKALGMECVPVEMPQEGPTQYRNLWLPLTGYEAYRAHCEYYPAREACYGDYLADVLRMGMQMTEKEYAEAVEKRSEFSARFEAALSQVDAVICPSGGMVFAVNEVAQRGDAEAMKEVIENFQGQFTIPADLAGTPTLSLPCGFNDRTQPYVMQLMGSKFAEATLCRIGHSYQSETDWHHRHPDH